MRKTDKMLMFEARHGMPIDVLVRGKLEENRGRHDITSACSRFFEMGPEGFRRWCARLDISIDDYRKAVAK